jgi:hypothetical protein
MKSVAKFTTVKNASEAYGNEGKIVNSINLNTVYDADPESENGKFFASTPSGSVNLNIVNSEAAEVFGQPGDEILVTFENLTAAKRAENDEQNDEEKEKEVTE